MKHLKILQKLAPGENVVQNPLVDVLNVFLPPLHIKLGLVKNVGKAIKKDGPAFYICSRNSPRFSEAKIKEGIFVDPKIRKLAKDKTFDSVLNKV